MIDDYHEKVVAIPDNFHVTCPDCGQTNDVELSEQDDGSFEPELSETFISCSCGKLMEVTGRWRNTPE